MCQRRSRLLLFPLYMESSGNYVDVCYREEGNMKHKLLRSTIKQMDEMMEKYGCFVRCHRAYIVNVNKIMNINGNAQGYRLNLELSLIHI